MDHFPEQAWVDYARDILSPEAKSAMENHLASGCEQCKYLRSVWQQVVWSTRRDAQFQPSNDSVRIAKAAFVTDNPWRPLAVKTSLAKLVFDSFQHSAPALFRSVAPAPRQLVHEVEPYIVDLRIEVDPAEEHVSLMGQVLNSKDPDQVIDNVEIVVIGAQQEPIAKTLTNPMGEFQMDFAAQSGLQLVVNIRGQKAIGIVLPEES